MSLIDQVLGLTEELASGRSRSKRNLGEQDLRGFEERTGITVPDELEQWLLHYNGIQIGPQGILGIRPDKPWLNVESHLSRVKTWGSRGWLPIAGDGFGNFYVLDSRAQIGQTRPVYFVDRESDAETPAYIVASGLWTFLRFLLEREKGRAQQPATEEQTYEEMAEQEASHWPFSREKVLSEDPALREYAGPVPFPWDADA